MLGELSGEEIPLDKAIVEGQLRGDNVTVLDPVSGEMITLDVAFRKGLIDRRTGSVWEPKSGKRYKPEEAIKLGLMAIAGAPVLAGKAVYDAVKGRKQQHVSFEIPKTFGSPKVDFPDDNDADSSLTSITESNDSSFMKEPESKWTNGTSEIQKPLTTIVYAKPGDRIKVTMPDQHDRQVSSPTTFQCDDPEGYGFVVSEGITDKQPLFGQQHILPPDYSTITSPPKTTLKQTSKFELAGQSVTNPLRVDVDSPLHVDVDFPRPPLVTKEDPPSIADTIVFVKSSDPPSSDKLQTPPLSPITSTYRTSFITKDDLTIDWSAGKVIIGSTGEVLNIAEAVRKGLLDSKTVETLAQMANTGEKQPMIDVNWDEGKIIVRETKEEISVTEAEYRGYMNTQNAQTLKTVIEKMDEIKKSNMQVSAPKSTITKSVRVPVKTGETLVVTKTKTVADKSHVESLSKSDYAENDGPLTLNDIAKDDRNIKSTGMVLIKGHMHPVTIKTAMDAQLIDIDNSCIIDPKSGLLLGLVEAVKTKVLNPESGQLTHVGTGEKITLLEACLEGLIPQPGYSVTTYKTGESERNDDKEVFNTSLSLEEAVGGGYVDEDSGTYTHPNTGEIMSLAAAIQFGFIDSVDIHHNETWKEKHVDRREEIIRDEQKVQLKPMKLNKSTVDTTPPFPIGSQFSATSETHQEAFVSERHWSDHQSDHQSDARMNKHVNERPGPQQLDMLRDQITSSSAQKTMQTSETRNMSYSYAIEHGYYSEKTGRFTEPQTGQEMSLQQAFSQGYVDQTSWPQSMQSTIAEKTSYSLAYAIEQGYFNEETGKFTEPNTGKVMTLQEALSQGYIDGNSLVFNVKQDEPGTLNDEIKQGRLDPVSGKVVDKKTNSKFTLKDAAKFGVLAVVGAPALAIKKAMSRSDKKDKTVATSSKPGDMVVQETVAPVNTQRNINNEDVEIPVEVEIPLQNRGEPVNLQTTYVQFIQPDILEICDVIHRQTFDTLPRKGDKMDNREKKIRRVKVLGVRDSAARRDIPLQHAVNTSVVNPNDATYHNTLTGQTITITEAIDLGYIQGKVIDSISLKEQTTKEGFQAKVLFEEKKGLSIVAVKDTRTGEKVSLDEAIQRGIISADGRTYMNQSDGRIMPIMDAVSKKLVTVKDMDSHMMTSEEFNKSKQNVLTQTKSVKVDSVIDPVTREVLTVPQAVQRDVLDLKAGVVHNKRTGEVITINDGLKQGLLKGSSLPVHDTAIGGQGLAQDTDADYHLKSAYDAKSGQYIPIKLAVDEGIIDSHHGDYKMADGQIIPVSKAIKEGLVKVERKPHRTDGAVFEKKSFSVISVVDPITGFDIPVAEAEDRGILNLKEGTYHNPMTQSTCDIPRAVDKGLLKTVPNDSSNSQPKGKSYHVDMGQQLNVRSVMDTRTGEQLSVNIAKNRGIVDDDLGKYLDQRTGETIEMPEAIHRGLVKVDNAESLTPILTAVRRESKTLHSVVHPVTKQEVPLSQAISTGLFDPNDGTIVNPQTGEKMDIEQASKMGLVKLDTDDVKEGVADAVIIKDVIVNKVKDPITGRRMSVREALKRGILDQNKGLYYDPHTGASMPIEEALRSDLIEGSHMSKSDVVGKKTKDMKQISVTAVLDPESGKEISVNEAIQRGIVNQDMTFYCNTKTGKKINMEDAFKNGQVSGVVQTITTTQTKMKTNKPGATYNITAVKDTAQGGWLTVGQALEKGILDDKGNFVDTKKDKTLPISKAIKKGLVRADEVSSATSTSKKSKAVSLREALQQGYIDTNSAFYTDPYEHKMYTVDESIRTGLLTTDNGKPYHYFGPKHDGQTHSFQHALQTRLLDPVTVMYNNNGTAMSVEDALKQRHLSPITGRVGGQGDSVIVLKGAEVMPVVSGGVLYSEYVDPFTGEEIDTKEATKRGLISKVKLSQPMTVSDALRTGLVDQHSGTYHDPKTGDKLSIDEAVICGFVKTDTPELLDDVKLGHSEDLPISLTDAIKLGCIDMDSASYTDGESGQTVSLQKALQLGYVQAKLSSIDEEGDERLDSVDASSSNVRPPTNGTNGINGTTTVTNVSNNVNSPDKYVTVTSLGSPFSPKTETVMDKFGDIVSKTATEVQVKTGAATFVTKPGFMVDSTGKVKSLTTGATVTFEEAVKAGLVMTESVECASSSSLALPPGPPSPLDNHDSASLSSGTTNRSSTDLVSIHHSFAPHTHSQHCSSFHTAHIPVTTLPL